jgi:hypothetical protein
MRQKYILKLVEKKKLFLIVSVSVLLSMIVLSRFIFTDLGLKSFGRIWQYYVSWGDFGFSRRSLVGTILTETGLNKILENEYIFAYIFYISMLALSYFLVVNFILANEKLRDNNILSFCVLLSPAMFSHFSHSTGSNDLILFIILLFAILYVRSAWMLSLTLISGILVHELFIFLLPGIFVLQYLTQTKPSLLFNQRLFLPAIVAVATIALVVLTGKNNIIMAVFEEIMAKRMPLAANQHPLWSGYSELSYTLQNHTDTFSGSIKSLWDNRWYAFIPTTYSFLIAWFVAKYLKSSVLVKVSVFSVILFPITAIVVATDFYRWTSMAACLGLVAVLILVANNKLNIPNKILKLLIVFSLVSPFGSAALDWPFPLHQFLLEKVMR